jgi:hypothetical protein
MVSGSARLKCIDCRDRIIVDIDPDEKYYTLSYVWGRPTFPDISTASGTSAGLLVVGLYKNLSFLDDVYTSLNIRYISVAG